MDNRIVETRGVNKNGSRTLEYRINHLCIPAYFYTEETEKELKRRLLSISGVGNLEKFSKELIVFTYSASSVTYVQEKVRALLSDSDFTREKPLM